MSASHRMFAFGVIYVIEADHSSTAFEEIRKLAVADERINHAAGPYVWEDDEHHERCAAVVTCWPDSGRPFELAKADED